MAARFELTEAERHAMWTLGKTAALAASVRIATSQQGRARLLQARIDLAREIHERVMQRLFGVSLVLGSEHGLSEEARRRCADEMQAALADLRDALGRPLAPRHASTPAPPCATSWPGSAATTRTCRSSSSWEQGVEVPQAVEPLAQSVLAEALRNADKHADPVERARARGPRRRRVRRSRCATTAPAAARAGPAWACAWPPWRRSAAGRCVEFGREGPEWRVRLVVPLEDGAERVSPERNLRVLVVDDHDVVHWGFRLLLTEQPWVERCLTASSVEEALGADAPLRARTSRSSTSSWARSPAPSCARRSGASRPRTRVLLISGAGWISPQAAKAAGASGFVSKDWSADDVAAAVRMVGKGMTVFAPRAEQPAAPLSEREREVLSLMASGATNKEIARAAVPVAAHGQGAHERALPQARRAQPGRGRAARRAARADRLRA